MTSDATERVTLLVVDPSSGDDSLASLRGRFEVTEAATEVAAIRSLRLIRPSAVVTESRLPEGDGLAVCREAKRQAAPPAVVVTTGVVEDAPAALMAGCDSVVVKPFPPNLLHRRLDRVLRDRAAQLQLHSYLQSQELIHLKERFAHYSINRVWSDTHCPSCQQGNAVSFDAGVHRRLWFACLTCQKVWTARPRGVNDQRRHTY